MIMTPMSLGGALLLSAGWMLQLVGVVTPQWVVIKEFGNITEGLFKSCDSNQCYDFRYGVDGTLRAIQTMVIMASVSGALALITILASLVCRFKKKAEHVISSTTGMITKRHIVPFCVFLASAAAFVFNFVGILLYAAERYEDARHLVDLGYSFIVCVVGGVIMGLGGGMFMLGRLLNIVHS